MAKENYKKYKLVYDTRKAINGSVSGIPAVDDPKLIDGYDVKDYKLVYVKDGNLMGSKKAIPTAEDAIVISRENLEGKVVEEVIANEEVPADQNADPAVDPIV